MFDWVTGNSDSYDVVYFHHYKNQIPSSWDYILFLWTREDNSTHYGGDELDDLIGCVAYARNFLILYSCGTWTMATWFCCGGCVAVMRYIAMVICYYDRCIAMWWSCCYWLQGFSPHISPFVQLRDMGALLGQAGYSLTTIVSVPHPSPRKGS